MVKNVTARIETLLFYLAPREIIFESMRVLIESLPTKLRKLQAIAPNSAIMSEI